MTSTGAERNQGGDSASAIKAPAISGNGRFVAYSTTATNVVPSGNPSGVQQLYAVDTQAINGVMPVTLVSASSAGVPGNAASPVGEGERLSLSYDGSLVSFTSSATNLTSGPVTHERDVRQLLHWRLSGSTIRCTRPVCKAPVPCSVGGFSFAPAAATYSGVMMQAGHVVVLVSLATFASTLAGGLLALRLKRRLHLILGFSAGAVVGVALFDLLPESLSLAGADFGIPASTAALAVGFLSYMVLNRLLVLHGPGALSAGSLCIHSFIDGVSIGLSFKVSMAVGAAVAVAVLVHDFSDGINTVGLVLRNAGGVRGALRWLLADALAPLAGVATTLLFTPAEPVLGLCLAVFAGFFLYIGASDLVPESYRGHPRPWTTVMTLLGAAVIYCGVRLAQR